MRKILIISTVFLYFSGMIFAQSSLYIDYSKKGASIEPSMYGIFFEEISHSGDGGLYAELIQNRGFEEHVYPSGMTYRDGRVWAPTKPNYQSGQVTNFNISWNTETLKYQAWNTKVSKCNLTRTVVNEEPILHKNTPHSMKMVITNMKEGGKVTLINSGYWGVPTRIGETYNLRFYMRSSDYTGKVKAKVALSTLVFMEHEFEVDNSGEWTEYRAELTAQRNGNNGEFQLEFDAEGTVFVDYVSLFPQETFNNRENGLRKDLAQLLAELEPAFIRWPGGCIVEGMTIENRVKWKETLGDPMTRRGEYNRWGYRSTYGFGYHEFLQFCEDVGADAMFVGNVGLSCAFNNGDYVPIDEVEPFIQDMKDAIEYAVGDPIASEWGAKRAANGHPEPFPLKYVELGNEQWGSFYPQYHDKFYAALKPLYPQITFISTLGLDADVPMMKEADMIDPHYYMDENWFYNNSHFWDNIKRDKDFKVYVGEYACNQNVGSGHFGAALSEAAYISGLERNGDLVTMSSYAPLIENSNQRNWPTNMIWVRNASVMGRSSYYVQKMYSTNRPDYNVPTTFVPHDVKPEIEGRIGLGSWLTQADYKNFKITSLDGSRVFYEADFTNKSDDWTPFRGNWTVTSGVYRQLSTETRCISMMDKWMFNDCVIEVKAQKRSGQEGFLIVLGVPEDNLDEHYQINIGGWGNVSTAIEKVNNGVGSIISETIPHSVSTNKWYDIKIVISGGSKIDCYIDGEYMVGCSFNTTGRLQAISGYDEEKKETVIKVINGNEQTEKINIKLNAKNIDPEGKVITLKAKSLSNENSFSNPTLITPVETEYNKFASDFEYSFQPYSFTILRFKSGNSAGEPLVISDWYSDNPIPINQTNIENMKRNDKFSFINKGGKIWSVHNEESTIETIYIINMNGEVLLKNDQSTDVNLSFLSAGTYLVKAVAENDDSAVKKIIVH